MTTDDFRKISSMDAFREGYYKGIDDSSIYKKGDHEPEPPKDLEPDKLERWLKGYKAAQKTATIKSSTGYTKEYYKELQKKKEAETGMKFIGSLGFIKRELLTSSEWVNVFDEKESYKSQEAIIGHYEKLYDIVTEFDDEGFRLWLKEEKKEPTQAFTLFIGRERIAIPFDSTGE